MHGLRGVGAADDGHVEQVEVNEEVLPLTTGIEEVVHHTGCVLKQGQAKL